MATEAQAQADLTTEPTVVDPLDATNSTNSGTNPIAAYEAELAAALNGEVDLDDIQGDEPVDGQETNRTGEESETAAETVAEEVIEEAAAGEVDDEAEVKAKDRFRFKDPVDQAVAAIAKAKGVSLVEAAKIFEGENPTKHQEETTTETQPSETVASVTATIDELRVKKREANSALDFDAVAELDAQIDELRDKRDELRISEVREQSQSEQAAERKFMADYAKSEDQAVKFYPDAAKADSALSKEMARLEAEMLELGDPLYYSENKPFTLAREAAKNLGVPMTNPNKPATKPAVTNRPMQPASGNARTTATAPAARLDDAIDGIGSINDYERFVDRLAKVS
jgi:hypothetical protein